LSPLRFEVFSGADAAARRAPTTLRSPVTAEKASALKARGEKSKAPIDFHP
jgi:hypothetical protein